MCEKVSGMIKMDSHQVEASVESHGLQCMEIWGGNHATAASAATPGLDIWVYSRPHQAAAAGGDVHYVSLCGGGRITRLIVADLSGHGQTACESALKLRGLMRKNINRPDQSRLVAALNSEFLAYSKLRRFATAIIATYLTKGDKLTICNAGHPRPFWHHAAEQRWEALSQASKDAGQIADLPLGVDEDTAYSQRELSLEKDDLIVFYTDALTEAEDANGRQLGEAGLLEIVRSLDVSRPDQLGPSLLQRVADFRGGQESNDDQTVMVLHHNASGPHRQSIRESIEVYAKVLGLKRV